MDVITGSPTSGRIPRAEQHAATARLLSRGRTLKVANHVTGRRSGHFTLAHSPRVPNSCSTTPAQSCPPPGPSFIPTAHPEPPTPHQPRPWGREPGAGAYRYGDAANAVRASNSAPQADPPAPTRAANSAPPRPIGPAADLISPKGSTSTPKRSPPAGRARLAGPGDIARRRRPGLGPGVTRVVEDKPSSREPDPCGGSPYHHPDPPSRHARERFSRTNHLAGLDIRLQQPPQSPDRPTWYPAGGDRHRRAINLASHDLPRQFRPRGPGRTTPASARIPASKIRRYLRSDLKPARTSPRKAAAAPTPQSARPCRACCSG